MKRDAERLDECGALVRQAGDFARRLAEEGVEAAIDPDAPPAAQFARLQQAVLAELARCREQAAASRQTEEALQRSRTLLAEAEKLSHTGAWEWDLATDQWTFSDEWLAIHGATARTLTPTELLGIAYPEDHPIIQQAFDEIRRGVSPYNLEHRIIRQDTGEVRTVRAQGRFVRDARGAVTRVYGFVQDITEQRQAEEALQKSEQQTREAEQALRVIFNSTYDAILLHDPNGMITDVNETFLRLYGVESREAACRLTVADFSSPSAPMETLPGRWARVLAGEALLFEWKARRVDDGREFDVEVFLRPITQHERRMLLANVRDITERKHLTATLEQRVHERTAALEAMNKELEAFSYSVSHDLRAPLRGIDGFSKLLLEKYEAQLDPTGQDYLRRVRAASQRMGRLIDDMLKLSRIGRAELRRAPVDLSELAEDIITELRQRDPERQVRVEIVPHLAVTGDASLLRIVLENLLGNAWKFTRKTTGARITFGAMTREDERVFYVCDNGAGFDMSYADKLFTPFQRLHSEEEFPGIGIGLAIVQRIIVRHGGRVWAEGKAGEGATVYFTLGDK